jgi:predicted flap endonuclease-1-like 5' DNA nuclease
MTLSFNQLAIYALVLILGWLFGLLSRSGGTMWRRKYEAERDARIALETEHNDRDVATRARIAELERHQPAIAAGTAGTVAAAASGQRDDLSLIRGVDQACENRLNDAGVHRFVDLSRLSDIDAVALEGRLGVSAGTIAREEWREQAALLASGRHDEHRSRFA